jgi:hypothetical protein
MIAGPLTFTISDVELDASNLVVTASSSATNVVPNSGLVLGGSGSNRTVTIYPATNQPPGNMASAFTTITLTVNDGKMSTSAQFILSLTNVNDAPTVSLSASQVVTPRGTNTFVDVTMADVEGGPFTLTLASSNPLLLPTNNIGIQNLNSFIRRLTMTPGAALLGQAVITITLSDGKLSTSTNLTVVVNDPPTIAAIANQTTYRSTPSAPIAITIGDTENVNAVTLTASSSNSGLVPASGFEFSGGGANRALVITPTPGQIGAATITITAFDGYNTTTRTFQLFVEEGLNYTFLKLPLPPGAVSAVANGLNNAGQVVGHALYQLGASQPVLWDVNGSVPTVSVLAVNSAFNTVALSVNDSGTIVGLSGGVPFIYDRGSVTLLPYSGSTAVYGINSFGAILGASSISASAAFYRVGNFATNLNGDFALNISAPYLLPNALGLNDQGEIAGISPADTLKVARFDDTGTQTTTTFGGFSGNLRFGGLNNVGHVAFLTGANAQGRGTPVVYDYRHSTLAVTGLLSALTTVPGVVTNMTFIHGINDADEIIGGNSQFSSATNRAGWLYSAGKAYAIQSFVTDPSYIVKNPVAINAAGDIIGTAQVGANLQGFLLRRQWLIGQPISVPAAAINPATQKAYYAPSVESLDGTPTETVSQSYVWGDKEQKLYFVRPIAVRVTWRTTSDLTDTNPPPSVVVAARAVWPTDAQLHVSGAPVEVLPLDPNSPYRAVALSYSTIVGATLDANSKEFSATLPNSTPGYSVIRSVIAPGTSTSTVFNPADYTNHFQVVKTVPWDSTDVLTNNVPATVGTAVSDPRGEEVATNSPKSGWVVNVIAPYDGAGNDRAYDRDTQSGPIIPVNRDNGAASNALVVAFYKRNPLTSVLWPDLSARFGISWPTNSELLVIANPQGSGLLADEVYPDKLIYNQPDRSLAGFNPNEEHAFFAPTTSGDGLFALRNDLNSPATSSNCVLLKYHDPDSGEWKMKTYRVVLEDATHHFDFAAQAGQEILPPYPLSLLTLCTGTNQTRAVSGIENSYRDNRGKFYALRGPINSPVNPVVVMNYFYPLQPGFYLNGATVGSCVEWRATRTNGVIGAVNVSFNIRWPDDTPVLEIGETLLDSKRGLPAIRNFASAKIVYDSLADVSPLTGGTRLYDPVSTRTLALTNVAGISASYQFPADVAMEMTPSGQQVFSKLAYHLRRRLSYNPANKTLNFSGVIDQTGLGEPLMLVNVISPLELQSLLALSSEPNFQNIMRSLYNLTRNPNRLDLDHNGAPDEALLIGLTVTNGILAQENLDGAVKALTAGIPTGSAPTNHYLVIAENDEAALGALPVTLHVIRVGEGPFRGDLKIIFPDNVFDERLTLRHSSDFGGDPSPLEFEWWYHPDAADFDPTDLPQTGGANGQVTDTRGWLQYRPPAAGRHFVTLGESGDSSLFTLIDNWFIMRYRGYNVDGATNWSDWIGDPASAAQTRAAFAPGWVKRVIEGINPFEARTTNFHETAASTYASLLIQAGERYEGDVALNPSGENLNSLGLIETYSTVLHRGRELSIDSATPVDSDSANNALLLAASRISDLYMLLGNEAFADAQDPTIGFFSDSLEFGTVATSIFAFKNQLDSLLDEELALLRGRDDSAAGVGARPVYNRLLWNFTGAEGEIAYERTYNVGDVNLDGVIDEQDARILFPQGHGDAWGHYLTALTTYYDLLRHPRFTWIPRSETVLIAGTAVQVDFLDERKFASAAALKAKAGAEIVDLTYRSKYVDNPEGQYQGYKDTKPDRAWGVSEWATRAGQAAYFDWITGNAILPSTDPNTNHVGIQKIDRQTVSELDEVVAHHREIQSQIDKVDTGLNPLGLAKGVVPFDIDPALLVTARAQGGSGQTHFEQIYNRAVQAMNNTVTMWNQANSLTEALRRQQDDVDDFTANVAGQERDYRNRLIESFGYPYAGDIGAGKTYPSGYDGPDIYHWMYVNTTELTGENSPPSTNFTGFFRPLRGEDGTFAFFPDGDANFFNLFDPTTVETSILPIVYPQSAADFAFTAPADWGSRRAPGEIQQAISDVVQQSARLKQALQNYDGLIAQIQDTMTVLKAQHNLTSENISILDKKRSTITGMNAAIGTMKATEIFFRRIAETVKDTTEIIGDGIPKVVGIDNDMFAPVRAAIKEGAFVGGVIGMQTAADGLEIAENSIELSKERVEESAEIELEAASGQFEVVQKLAELKEMIRNEAAARLECYNQREALSQTIGRYQSALAAGQRLLQERIIFRQRTAGTAQQNRYKDAAFRIFRNEALQKYRAQFDLAARYVYLAAAAYDYEVNFLGSDPRGASDFFTDIVRERSLGVMVGGLPITGKSGLSDPLARLKENFEVLAPRFGLNNPQQETARFSLRKELFRIRDESTNQWKALLRQSVVKNLWDVPEFRRYCRPFALESAGPQPGIVIHFPTTINFGFNFFGHPLGGGDSAYDPSLFTTKVNSVGVWFRNYNGAGLATAPRVYLFPAGMDIMRSPTGDTLATRQWKVLDQVVPVPFPIGANDLADPAWIPQLDELSDSFAQIRRYSSFRAYHDAGVYDITQTTQDTRLIGRSVWNTDWVLIIPGGTLLADPDQGLDAFVDSVSDILISLQSYSYPGD